MRPVTVATKAAGSPHAKSLYRGKRGFISPYARSRSVSRGDVNVVNSKEQPPGLPRHGEIIDITTYVSILRGKIRRVISFRPRSNLFVRSVSGKRIVVCSRAIKFDTSKRARPFERTVQGSRGSVVDRSQRDYS